MPRIQNRYDRSTLYPTGSRKRAVMKFGKKWKLTIKTKEKFKKKFKIITNLYYNIVILFLQNEYIIKLNLSTLFAA